MEIDLEKCKDYNAFCYRFGILCKVVNTKLCIYKQFQQLKAENEELKKIQLGHSQGENLYNLYQYKQCLDEIEKICNDSNCDNTVCEKCRFNPIDCDFDRRKAVLKIIKEFRENR